MADKPANLAEYLATLGDEQRAVVEQLRATVRDAAPSAAESFSYGMPGFTVAGRPLVWVAAWKRHYSLYPVSAEQVAAAASPGESYEVEKATVRFRPAPRRRTTSSAAGPGARGRARGRGLTSRRRLPRCTPGARIRRSRFTTRGRARRPDATRGTGDIDDERTARSGGARGPRAREGAPWARPTGWRG